MNRCSRIGIVDRAQRWPYYGLGEFNASQQERLNFQIGREGEPDIAA